MTTDLQSVSTFGWFPSGDVLSAVLAFGWYIDDDGEGFIVAFAGGGYFNRSTFVAGGP